MNKDFNVPLPNVQKQRDNKDSKYFSKTIKLPTIQSFGVIKKHTLQI